MYLRSLTVYKISITRIMRAKIRFFILLFSISLFSGLQLNAQNSRKVVKLDSDWKFYLGDQPNAKEVKFDDSAWRKLDVPHDWSIEGEYQQTNPTGRGGGFLPSGIGWYRKQLVVSQSEAGKRIFIKFDGVMSNSDVWINGQHLGNRPYGYSSFSYELTGKLTFGEGKPNIIAVRVDNSRQPASRWYAGAGIYRHVRLISLNPVHIGHWGVFVTTPKINNTQATVSVEATVSNQSEKAANLYIQTIVTGPDGRQFKSAEIPLSVDLAKKTTCKQEILVINPKLWDTQQPNLYTAVTTIRSGKTILDYQENRFGIREFHFEAATGFYLNGVNMKILGVCLHQDGGPVGVAVPTAVWERRLENLKKIGVNAIRTAHNPMDPGFYDLCDQMGFLVMNESFDTWTVAKPNGTQGYNLYFNDWWEADTRDMVLRDRNHPSIILYCLGNEIRDRLDQENGRQRFLNQRDLVSKLDSTRPVTLALFRPNEMQVYNNGFSELMDVVGQNYRENELVAAWNSKPDRKVIGTENGHNNAAWLVLRDNPFMSGQFLWTGIDYLGEANWPEISWGAALLDRNGFMKPAGYERQSWWSDKPMVKIVRSEDNSGKGQLKMDWTPADFGTYDEAYVYVYSNCDEVELFLNDISKGSLPINKNATPRFWNIGFEAGTIRAVGFNKGIEVAKDEMKTAETAVKILLTQERTKVRNTWEDLVYIKATAVDKNGLLNPNINPIINFTVSGAGVLNSVDNGSILSHEKYKTNSRSATNGTAVALVQAIANTGKIIVSATAEGLEGSTIELVAIPAGN